LIFLTSIIKIVNLPDQKLNKDESISYTFIW